VSVNTEAVSPPATDVSSIGGDYGIVSPASPPSTYEAVRGPNQAGQTEGFGLLGSMTGSAGDKISRKSVSGYVDRSGNA